MIKKNPWKVVSDAVVYENNWIKVNHQDVINPNGGNGIYGKVHFKNIAVGIVPIDDEGNTWLVGQYRYPINEYTWEIPEGGCPIGLTAIEGAKRELLEETGLLANQWELITKLHLSNSVCDEVGYVYTAKQLTQVNPQPEETEQLTIMKLPLIKAFEMVANFTITDSLSVAALQHLQIKLLQNNNQ
jgi:ADP-ribose pyrophosphatase